VAHDIRDAIMDFIAHRSERAEIGALQLVGWIDLSRSKFYSWRDRYGKANEHNIWRLFFHAGAIDTFRCASQ